MKGLSARPALEDVAYHPGPVRRGWSKRRQMPIRGHQLVTLDPGDTLHSARAKLDSAVGGQPIVVLASNCRIAANALTYKLLARASERFVSPILLVAGNPKWRREAREQGLGAYASIGSLRRARGRSIFSLAESLADSLVCSLHLSLTGFVVLMQVLLATMVVVYLSVPVMHVTIRNTVEVLDREMSVRVVVGAEAVDLPSSTIPGRIVERRFSVSGSVETTGSKDDRARSNEALVQHLQARGLNELGPGVRQSESLIPHSLRVRVDSVDYDETVDAQTEQLKGTAYGTATGIAFANRDLNSLVEQQWRGSPPRGYRALAGELQLSPPVVLETGPAEARLRVQVSGQAERVLDLDKLVQGLRETRVEEAKARLARLERPLRLESLQMWPEWAPIAHRVEVRLVQ